MTQCEVTGLVESVTDYLVGLFQNTIPKEVIIFFISMLPVLELRGGMIAAKLLGVNIVKAFIICYVGNIVPVPLIILFIRKIFRFLEKFGATKKLVSAIERNSDKKKDKIIKYREWGLLAFVAIPLPGTGGWTGALLAALLDIRLRKSFPIIALGVLIADIIMLIISYGVLGLIL